jgi:protein phosphatase methylesterase 1
MKQMRKRRQTTLILLCPMMTIPHQLHLHPRLAQSFHPQTRGYLLGLKGLFLQILHFKRRLTYPCSAPNKRSLDQIPWTTYFERELFLESTKDATTTTHHAYLTSPVGAAPLFVTHHGAGSSGLSFAVLAAEIRKRLPSAGILSIDARGHGSTTMNPEPESIDLTLETLSADLLKVVEETKSQMGWPNIPPLVLIGHSLGGAVVTDVAKGGKLGHSVLGYAVLDVVEGSAMDALQSMQTYLSTRPLGFPSLELGIDWHIRSRTIRNSLSARTSVPALLTCKDDKVPRPWVWRTDLAGTQPFWEGWFVGLSKKFLEARGGKLLILAGTDRLDTELTIGQMQGILHLSCRRKVETNTLM